MTSQEWKELISKEFNVSNSVAKGMLHAMYEAKRYLDVPRNIHKKQSEDAERRKKQIEEWEYMDMCDDEFMSKHTQER